MSAKQCAVSYGDGLWEVLFDCEPEPRRIAFKSRTQAVLSATEWTWSERLKGHRVDLSLAEPPQTERPDGASPSV